MPAPPDDASGARDDERSPVEASDPDGESTETGASDDTEADGAAVDVAPGAEAAGGDEGGAPGARGAEAGLPGAPHMEGGASVGTAAAGPSAAEVASDSAGALGSKADHIADEPSGAAAVETGNHAEEVLAPDREDRAAAAGPAGEATEARASEPARGAAAAAPVEDAPGADASAAGQENTAPAAEGAAEEAPPPDPALFAHALRIAEALVFASDRPVTPARVQSALPPGCDARAVLTALAASCADRPVQLVEVAGGFAFRTAPELSPAITRVVEAPRRLPRAAMETLAIVAYHQPVTRAEIEEIRGASLSQSTLEALLEMALIAPRGRKEVPGRPSLWGTTPRFLEQFGLKSLNDLPRREELVNEPTLPLGAPPSSPAP